jgi:transcriptional regulator with XRE-family HTH domain
MLHRMNWRNMLEELIAAGMTQVQIAAALGISQSRVSRLCHVNEERNRISYAVGVRLIELHRARCAPDAPEPPRIDAAPQPLQSAPKRATDPQWFRTDAGIEAKGRELGIAPRRGETYRQYRDRIAAAINTNPTDRTTL